MSLFLKETVNYFERERTVGHPPVLSILKVTVAFMNEHGDSPAGGFVYFPNPQIWEEIGGDEFFVETMSLVLQERAHTEQLFFGGFFCSSKLVRDRRAGKFEKIVEVERRASTRTRATTIR